jgi:hypothetical protein
MSGLRDLVGKQLEPTGWRGEKPVCVAEIVLRMLR